MVRKTLDLSGTEAKKNVFICIQGAEYLVRGRPAHKSGSEMMVRKKRKKAAVRPVVSLRVRPAMYEDLVREADKRRLKLSEEVERRLIGYDEMIAAATGTAAGVGAASAVGQAILGAGSDTDAMIDKLAERIAKKLKPK
jgi:hypothetical protein